MFLCACFQGVLEKYFQQNSTDLPHTNTTSFYAVLRSITSSSSTFTFLLLICSKSPTSKHKLQPVYLYLHSLTHLDCKHTHHSGLTGMIFSSRRSFSWLSYVSSPWSSTFASQFLPFSACIRRQFFYNRFPASGKRRDRAQCCWASLLSAPFYHRVFACVCASCVKVVLKRFLKPRIYIHVTTCITLIHHVQAVLELSHQCGWFQLWVELVSFVYITRSSAVLFKNRNHEKNENKISVIKTL